MADPTRVDVQVPPFSFSGVSGASLSLSDVFLGVFSPPLAIRRGV